MNARQKAKKYKKMYEEMAKMPVPTRIIYKTALDCYEAKSYVDRMVLACRPEIYGDLIERAKETVREKLSRKIPVDIKETSEGYELTGRVWVDEKGGQ